MKVNNKEIRVMVLKNLIRVLKNHKMYPILRTFINHTSNKDIYTALNLRRIKENQKKAVTMGSDNPFLRAKSFNEMVNLMSSLDNLNVFGEQVRKERESTSSTQFTNKEIQSLIMKYTNNILHFTVELGVRDMRVMEDLGKETFEMTCKAVFGEDFVDEMIMEVPEIKGDDRTQRLIEMIREMQERNGHSNGFIDHAFYEGPSSVRNSRWGHINPWTNGVIFDDDDDVF